jgi:hypothetical protein
MSTYEKTSLALALIAIVVSIAAFVKSTSVSKDNLKLNHGMNELEVKNMITSARQRVEDVSIMMIPLLSKTQRSEEEVKQVEGYQRVFRAAVENSVNAYEEACAKYLDRKIDKRRFKKSYQVEIRQLVQDANHKQFFDAVTSPHKAILKVYDEWENLEK